MVTIRKNQTKKQNETVVRSSERGVGTSCTNEGHCFQRCFRGLILLSSVFDFSTTVALMMASFACYCHGYS